ncbi:MAG TPA: phosphopentomutase [Gemmatimonas aurantiaca]|uniref:Phosphopentomutase n=2 Tax=Gemmatimonas aurantiaca TaxID=173480 RepID=C1A8D2_GEMAT|nr:phosphopentomutase [Gemmatimonas aurantiaca]BAH38492.1 phosphopentomutase [Gemmatimonas aurantiaca T-27]HCT56181.1 phosphopentomutase [Gemmatimonas aurantiaca]
MNAERRALVIVLDGVGCGEAPDTAAYGDLGSDTLGNVARVAGGMETPNLQRLGIANATVVPGLPPVEHPIGGHGVMLPRSAGKDSTTGHWEIAGLHLAAPFPTYPQGFPPAVIEAFAKATGRGVVANSVASGTAVIADYAEEQRRTGAWIVYTSADSVFQVAAHEDWIPLEELYRACEIARAQLVAPHDVSRVIARPFVGERGQWRRTPNRRDFSIAPPGETLLDVLQHAGIPRHGIGKVDDLFAGRGIAAQHTTDNAEGIQAIQSWLETAPRGFCFANLVDFDQLFGHRNDVPGFRGALEAFDRALPSLLAALKEDDLLFITADHGNDPTTPSTDHARERVPLLVAGARVRGGSLGVRDTFSDLGASVAHWFGLDWRGRGTSFLPELLHA